MYLSPLEGTDNLTFFMLGDWGGQETFPYTSEVAATTADRMADLAMKLKPQFIVSLGDNFYDDGVVDVEDKRFQRTYEKVYDDPALNIPWYIIAGNHDWRGNVSAQIEYSKRSHRWNFPFYFYPLSFTIPGTNDTVDILMIDTNILCLKEETQNMENVEGIDHQWEWLETNLKNSKAKYLLTIGHMPVYSVGWHGSSSCLIERFLPLLEKYNVNAHIAGHDHSFQARTNDMNLDLIVCGMGSAIDNTLDNSNTVPEGLLKFHWGDEDTNGGFCVANVTADGMTISFIQTDTEEPLYETNIYPRRVPP
ncbi:hypothetical protein LOTGIDRAFT_133469 [Lottia gigantea]|uniref:Tartrate-resistant acid phosphatase type 5 n=1 Tax=Lottia gigantea TaxID=225164 RepID=V3YZ82_LOTGI|nr:hypothetical protein LOTGIDRAFT_133469 [Lottia gigantea]ESO83458.1 hypothetical protein LOTGIDRAFT_133469 [Lottia gigantea]